MWDGRGERIGRSAYICPSSECVEKALAKDRLARAIKKPVPQEDLEQLRKDIECKLR